MRKSETKALNVTKEAKHRVFVGLGWDPADDPGLVNKVKAMAKGEETHHDLDLSCYAFDSYKAFAGFVSALPEHASIANDTIYHSGDNEEGVGEGDDEEISVELKDLPDDIHDIIFTATVTSGQSFSDVKSPEMRIADGYTDHNFLHHDLGADAPKNANVFIFVKLTRGEDGWSMTYIGNYARDGEIGDYEEYLRSYL
ncbi:MAG: TerD family protein [Alphaproteobacteria bacterium]